MTRLLPALLLLAALPGCFDLGDFDFNFNFCQGAFGDQGRYTFIFQEGVVFPDCPGPGAVVLPSDGAKAQLSIGAGSDKTRVWSTARSSDPSVFEITDALLLTSHSAGSGVLELVDDSQTVVDSIRIPVVDPESLDVANSTPDLRVMTGARLTTTVTPLRTGTKFVGAGAGHASAAAPLSIVSPLSASADVSGLFANLNSTPTTLEVSASAPGASVLTLTMGATAKSSLLFQILDPGSVDEAHAVPDTLFLPQIGDRAEVTIVGSSGSAPVRGLACHWSVPSGVTASTDAGVENLGAAPGSSYSIDARAAGHWTARCTINDSLFVDVPVTVTQ